MAHMEFFIVYPTPAEGSLVFLKRAANRPATILRELTVIPERPSLRMNTVFYNLTITEV